MWKSNDCIKCQWCCRVANVPIPGGEEFAYLYWIKGRRIYWEPFTGEWYWLVDDSCQHICDTGCKIYATRPRLCREWYCPFGPTRIKRRFDILCAAGNRIMKQIHDRGTYK